MGARVRDLTFTYYENQKTTEGEPMTLSWEQWCKRLTAHVERGGAETGNNKAALDYYKGGPAILLGYVPAGERRSAKNVRAVHAIGIDFDNGSDEQIGEAIYPLRDFAYVMYTTHKHAAPLVEGRTRLRVILPLEQTLPPEQFDTLFIAVSNLCLVRNDQQAQGVQRIHYLPSSWHLPVAWSHVNNGVRWLNPHRDLAQFFGDADAARTERLLGESTPEAASQVRKIRGQLKFLDATDPLKESVTALLKGEPFETAGNRHQKVLELTYLLAEKDTELRPEAIATLFATSLNLMGGDAPKVDEVIRAYEGAVALVNKQRETLAEEKRKKALEIQLVNAADGQGSYTQQDLDAIAAVQGCTRDELRKRWIVQRDTSFYFLGFDGGYRGPYSPMDARGAAVDLLARSPVQLNEIGERSTRRRPVPELVEDYGSVADRIIADLGATRTVYEPKTRTLREAVTPMRQIVPEFNDQIDGWLRVLAGDVYPKLIDWLSCVPKLNRLLCAVYFAGKPGGGKNLLAYGLARLWTKGNPADIEDVLAGFNEDLIRCPLVFADENLPRQLKGNSVTGKLRSMISTYTRTLLRKYRAPSELHGAIRMVLAANHDFLLETREASTQDDLTAIAQRFLYIKVEQEAVDFIQRIPIATKNSWVEGDKIAAHVLYLSLNHDVVPGKRFWVEGDVTQMHRLLMTGSLWNSQVCEWLVRYLLNPKPFDNSAGRGLIRCIDGEMLVNTQAIIDGWRFYFTDTRKEAETQKIGQALRALAKGKSQRRLGSKAVRYYVINIEHLLDWSEQNNVGDRETMERTLGGDLIEDGEDTVGPTQNSQEVPF